MTSTEITLTVLYDNCQGISGFRNGWGFSCLIEKSARKILFDAGPNSEDIPFNLAKSGILPEEITDVVCSHKHFDHIGGLKQILPKLQNTVRFFLPKQFPVKKIPTSFCREIVEEYREIAPGIYSLPLKGGLLLSEQALIIETKTGLVIITGCAHPGIPRILEEVRRRRKEPIRLLLGGFHLFRSSRKQIDQTVQACKTFQVQAVAPCHCTGDRAMDQFREAFGEAFYSVGSGTVL